MGLGKGQKPPPVEGNMRNKARGRERKRGKTAVIFHSRSDKGRQAGENNRVRLLYRRAGTGNLWGIEANKQICRFPAVVEWGLSEAFAHCAVTAAPAIGAVPRMSYNRIGKEKHPTNRRELGDEVTGAEKRRRNCLDRVDSTECQLNHGDARQWRTLATELTWLLSFGAVYISIYIYIFRFVSTTSITMTALTAHCFSFLCWPNR